jgi:hypothetical protein
MILLYLSGQRLYIIFFQGPPKRELVAVMRHEKPAVDEEDIGLYAPKLRVVCGPERDGLFVVVMGMGVGDRVMKTGGHYRRKGIDGMMMVPGYH